jgi:PGF-pre-PGF domain-containing protein
MKLRSYSLLLIFLLVVSAASGKPKVYLDSGTLTTGNSEFSTFSTSSLMDSNSEYKILQFRDSTTQDYRDLLKQEGVKFDSYIPENAWLVKLDGVKEGDIIRRDKVWFLGPYRPSHKIASNIKKERSGRPLNITVTTFEDIDSGFKDVLSTYSRINRDVSDKDIEVKTEVRNFSKISRLENVKFISAGSGRPQTTNDESRKLIDAERLQISPYNLEGDGFTAGVWDAGWAGNHSDLNYTGKRVVGDKGGSCGSCSVEDHGTHVAGTLLGGGRLDSSYRGIAPEATLATYEWPTSGSSELYEETNDSLVKYDSTVSQNSWGFGYDECYLNQDYIYGDYDSWSRYYDKMIHGDTNKVEGTLSVVFSAGNERNNNCGSYNTTNFPSTAKNVITVGAVDGNAEMTSFSSWGPTDDGRIKPDIVAHGSSITSTEPGNIYRRKWGTSMAAPAISGAVVLLNQQFNRSYGKKPAPATVKGLLIHKSEDLNRTGPDYITGWGLANVTESVNYVKKSYNEGLIRRKSINQDQNHTYDRNISTEGSAKFTLVWSDHPASSGASETLVNDLDLVIRNSTGHRYYPWTLNWSMRKEQAVRTKPDRTNNLEQVYIPSVTSENLTITINGTSVPQGPQSYTLLMSEKTRITPELEVESPKNISYPVSPTFNFTSSNTLLSAKFSINSGKNRSLSNASSEIFYNETTDVAEGRHNVTFWAEYSEGNWTSTTQYFTTDYTKPDITPLNPVNSTNLSEEENITASWDDNLTGVKVAGAVFENSTFNHRQVLNYSFNFSNLQDGDYNFTFTALDYAGNTNKTPIKTSVDNKPPVLTSSSPASSQALKGNFTVNATYRDNGTAVKTAEYWLANSSGVERTGSFNDTVNSSKYANGDYNLSYRLTDYEDNLKEKNISLTIDNADPDLGVLSPLNGSYVGPEFWVNASISGTYSSVVEKQFNVSNSTFSETGDNFNATLDTQQVSEGDYNITYTVSDGAGNEVSKRVNVTLDKTSPSVNLALSGDSTIQTANFTVNATYNDGLSGVDTAKYYVRNSSGLQMKGTVNATLNSSKLADGSYTVDVEVKDTAGNIGSESADIEVDNSPPVLEFSTLNTPDNLTGTVEIETRVSDISGLDTGLFRWYNTSGNVTGWRDVNTTFDFETLQTGEYNLSYRFNDTLGFTSVYNKTDITVDNTLPDISLQDYVETEKYSGWIRDNVTVETSCSDTGSGFKSAFLRGTQLNSSTVTPVNFTVSEHGNNSYSFECSDYTGNVGSEDRRYSIDAQAPEIASVTPDQDLNTDRKVTVVGNFNDEASESGLNVSASNLQVSEGDIVNTQWSNDSFSAEVKNLSYSTDFSLTGQIVDNVGHSYDVDLGYSTRSEPESGSSSTDTSIPSSGSNTTSNDTEEDKVEPVFETLDDGLSVSNLNLTSGEVETVEVSNYSSGTVSTVKLIGSSSGPVGLEVSGLESSGFSVPSGVEAERFVHMSVVNSSGVDNITVEFETTSSWLDSIGLRAESISLFRVGSKWEKLDTSIVSEGNIIRYSSNLEKFSNFSIAAEKACRGQTVYAVNTEGTICEQYSSACEKSESWNEVDSCQSWNDRQEVEKVIQKLSEQKVSEQKIEGVREEYKEGNYSGALKKANEIQKDKSDNGGDLMKPLLGGLLLIVLLAVGGYAGYIYHSRRQLEDEIEELGGKLIDQTDEGEINTHQEAADKMMHAKKALKMDEYSKAENYLERYKEMARKKGLPM